MEFCWSAAVGTLICVGSRENATPEALTNPDIRLDLVLLINVQNRGTKMENDSRNSRINLNRTVQPTQN